MAKPLTNLSELLSPDALQLLTTNGKELVTQIGMDVVRGVVFDVLTGRNLRDSTEALTRRRVGALNLAMVGLFLKGAAQSSDFVAQLPYLATDILNRKRVAKAEKWLAQWVLGLNDKAFQNVLRDSTGALAQYRDQYVQICQEVVESCSRSEGDLTGSLRLGSETEAAINWLTMTYLTNAIGAQTLAIRGSEKSTYGKLFEKLILGSLLYILGFKHISPPPQEFKRVFWLSSRNEKRESDATLLYDKGQGVRFDIGFIGRGNPEISLDKVTRFEREITLGRSTWYMATIILVDRIGANSRIQQLAERVGGTIIQMSASYWPQQVAQELRRATGYRHELADLPREEIEPYLRRALAVVPIEELAGVVESQP